ncbi:MAG: AAA family ATPase [Sedimenticola sp.]
MQGLAQVSVTPCPSVAVPPKKVFDALEHDRAQGTLKNVVTKAKIQYEVSQRQPGLLNRVHTNGTLETGRFHNGEFIPVMLVGGNGAGKSTLFRQYLEPEGIQLVNADNIAKTMMRLRLSPPPD